MALHISLQDMPQLVLEKITSFLNHNQLLVLEQVSKKLNSAVDCRFTFTDHLILGSLPATAENENEEKIYLDSFNNIIERCGTRLRTIQVNVTDPSCTKFLDNYFPYFWHLFESVKLSGKCPNIENIFVLPKMVVIREVGENFVFNQNVVLHHEMTYMYANQIYETSTGQPCKLRSMDLKINEKQQFEEILRLYPNLEQIAFSEDNLENLLKCLPKFIENGLKDLRIRSVVKDFQDAKKLCDIGKNLRTLDFMYYVIRDDDLLIRNLQPPANVKIRIWMDPTYLVQLNKSVCESVVMCNFSGSPYSDCSTMLKMKNLEEIDIYGMVRLLYHCHLTK